VAQFYYFAPFDIVSSFTFLSTFVPELRQKETVKTVFNLGSCWLHILQDDFRDGCNAANWNIEDRLSCLRCLLKDSPARREDITKVKGVHNFALGFLGMFQLLREHHQYRLISRCVGLSSFVAQTNHTYSSNLLDN
jgi:hypothetical protein